MEKLDRIFEIGKLIAKGKTGKLSDAENEFLRSWLAERSENLIIYNKLQDGKILINELNELNKFDEQKAFQKVEHKISSENHRLKIFRFVPNYINYAAAVAMIAVCSILIISKINRAEKAMLTQNTIIPGKQRAILITADNHKIELDSSDNKQIIKTLFADIIHLGSTLSYSKGDSVVSADSVPEYNILITPIGGAYSLFLSDSTEVILNSGSELRYPVLFNNNIREVELEGEAFFKVKKSNKIPFVVKTSDINVTVYGTVFNISAFRNETLVQTTLLEGSIGVSLNNLMSGSEIKIRAGQQLTFDKGTGSAETKEVNTEQFIAWTIGRFVFVNEPIDHILKVMSRWYDFNFEFKDENLKIQRFTLSLNKYGDINKILDMISVSSNLKFSTSGNSILVYSD